VFQYRRDTYDDLKICVDQNTYSASFPKRPHLECLVGEALRDRLLQDDGAKIKKELPCRPIGSILKADAMTENERDNRPKLPAASQELVPNAKSEGDHADLAAREDPPRTEPAKPRKLVTQGRRREALKRRFT
jgi:hypothetical protein